jgi:glucose/arabinose dehydrogenase
MHVLLVLSAVALACASSRAAENVPAGYELSTFASGFDQPISLAVAPDGRVFVGQKNGEVWTVDGVSPEPKLFLSIEVYNFSECGLLGIALDPDFASNGYIYFFATVSPDEQQILRYTDVNGLGTDATVIRAGLPTVGQLHNGGGIRIGPDRKLYFSIGDNGQPELSQQMHTFAGKICRINLDGSTPTDNPFKTPTGTPRAIFALGFRNPFRFCFAPDGRLFVMDVGSDGNNRREEINLVTPGSNGGWPLVEGVGDAEVNEPLLQPILAYSGDGTAITGCAFNTGVNFANNNEDGLFHLDFVSNTLYFASVKSETTAEHVKFMQVEGGVIELAVGPDGGLLYTEMFTGNVKQLHFLSASSGSEENPMDLDNPDDPDNPNPLAATGSPCGAGAILAFLPMLSAIVVLRLRNRE